MNLEIWYVPTVFACKDILVSTTKPLKLHESTTISFMGKLLNKNISFLLAISMPSEVIRKCRQVKVMFGKEYWVYIHLLTKTMDTETPILSISTTAAHVCEPVNLIVHAGLMRPVLFTSTINVPFSTKESSEILPITLNGKSNKLFHNHNIT